MRMSYKKIYNIKTTFLTPVAKGNITITFFSIRFFFLREIFIFFCSDTIDFQKYVNDTLCKKCENANYNV
jgi:hypothetical protein